MTDDGVSALDALFGVLADPTRRALLRRLLHDGPASATRLAEPTPLTRQAVAKHLRALLDAGLVTSERVGREVLYRATPEPLVDAIAWLVETAPAWDERLARLRRGARERSAAGR